ncbi:MAG: hypothetical protein ACJ8JD_05845 [Chthoniobacterales bacterium]
MGDEVTEGIDFELDWLDRRMREEAHYIDDAGFTANVMQKLPARRATRSLRATILVATAVLASLCAYYLSGGGRFIYEALARAELFSPLAIVIAALAVGVALTLGAAYAAMRRSEAL